MKEPKQNRCKVYDDCLECGKRTRTRIWMYHFVFCSLKCMVLATGDAEYEAQ